MARAILAAVHGRLGESFEKVRGAFHERSWFESLRIEPYYLHSSRQIPETASFFERQVDETRHTSLALVHGDYSPKNILIYNNRLILLDHEVAHFGNPAFDLGFSLTHLLSKANHCRDRRDAFLSVAKLYVSHCWQKAPHDDWGPEFAARAARHTLACLLARVVGRSPLEYLDESERNLQVRAALDLIRCPPDQPIEIIEEFGRRLRCQ